APAGRARGRRAGAAAARRGHRSRGRGAAGHARRPRGAREPLMGRRRDPQSLRAARGSGKHRGRAWAWTCLLAATIIATFTVLRVREGPLAIAPAPRAVTAPAHHAFAMSLVEAYDQAAKRVGSLRPLESLPYFQRMIAGLPEDDWALRHDYANALQGASVEGRTVLGLLVPAARSS